MKARNGCPQPAAFPSGLDESSEPFFLPPLRVITTAEEVSGFARAICAENGNGRVPLTFPIRWLALPSVHDWLLQLIGRGYLPVHEAQNFIFERELEMMAEYILRIEAKQISAPARLTLAMSISTPEGDLCAICEAVLRLVPLDPGAG